MTLYLMNSKVMIDQNSTCLYFRNECFLSRFNKLLIGINFTDDFLNRRRNINYVKISSKHSYIHNKKDAFNYLSLLLSNYLLAIYYFCFLFFTKKSNFMKKFYLFITIFTLLASYTFAQTGNVFLSQSFDSDDFPTDWTAEAPGVANWKISKTANANGTPNELKLDWSPAVTGVLRYVSPAIDLTGESSVLLEFKYFYDHYTSSNKIGVATSSDNGITWNTVWIKTLNADDLGEVIAEVSNSDMGKENVKFCFFYEGNTYNMDGLFFDDFSVEKLVPLDGAVQSIHVNEYSMWEALPVKFTLLNKGVETINSVKAQYSVGDYVITQVFDNLDLAKFQSKELTFDNLMITPAPGDYDLEVTILEVNEGADDNEVNNTLSKNINMALYPLQRVTMIEHFTSSTCPPCVAVNVQLTNLTQESNHGKYTLTKYPMSWPGNGDPYYTPEGGARRTFYGVSGVPASYFNGVKEGYPLNQASLDNANEAPSYLDIRGGFVVNGNIVQIELYVTSTVAVENCKLHLTINEKLTTGNVGTNGETSFKHVMMKMVPDALGTDFSIGLGEVKKFTFVQDMASTHVEEMSDLEIAAFIQLPNKMVMNSRYLDEYTQAIPPVKSLTVSEPEANVIKIDWEAPDTNLDVKYRLFIGDEILLENSNATTFSTNMENGPKVVRVETVVGQRKSVARFAYIVIDGVPSHLESMNEEMFDVYPNPATNYIEIAGKNIQQAYIYNTQGQLIDKVNNYTKRIDVSNYNSGVYLVKAIFENGKTKTKKVIVK